MHFDQELKYISVTLQNFEWLAVLICYSENIYLEYLSTSSLNSVSIIHVSNSIWAH